MKKLSKLTKAAAIFMAASMLVATAGCSGKADTSSTANKTTNLTWWMIGAPGKDNDKVMTELNKYLKEKYNVTVTMNFSNWGDYDQKLKTVISSGTPYDIAFTCAWANSFSQQAMKGAYMPLDDLIESNGQGLKELIPSDVWDAAKVKGKIYGIPTYKDSANDNFIVYAKQYIDESKFDYTSVKNIKDIEPYLAFIKQNHPELTAMPLMQDGWPGLFDNFDQITGNAFGAIKLSDSSLKVVNMFDDADLMNDLRTLHSFYQAGYINKDAATAKESPKVSPVSHQNGWPAAVANWSSSWGYEVVANQASDLYLTTSSLQGSLNAISKNSKNGAAAVTLLNAVNTDPVVKNMLCFGIEGTNYEKTGDTSIKQLNQDYTMSAFAVTSFFGGLYTVDPAPKNEWSDLQEFISDAKPSPALGFMFDSSDTKIQTQIAALNNIYNKYKTALLTGTSDPDVVVPQMKAEMDKVGYQDFLAEVQKQVNDWKATK